MPISQQIYDLAVVGAGSGGLGAAITAARAGMRVVLIEKSGTVGGTAVRGGVTSWESGVVSGKLPHEIFCRLSQLPSAVGVTSIGRHICWAGRADANWFPGGENIIDASRGWNDTLRRSGTRGYADDPSIIREHWHAVVFEPDAYSRVVRQMLDETGSCDLLLNTACTDAQVQGRQIKAIQLSTGASIPAAAYIDASADIHLARAAACRWRIGLESREAFGEPSAPLEPSEHLNAVTLIYRVTPKAQPGVDAVPDDVPESCWWGQSFPVSHVIGYPNGDMNINMLPTMEGHEAAALGEDAAIFECRRRVLAHWRYWQREFSEWQRYRIASIAPALGVREGPRLAGRYTLTEHDLRAGVSGQNRHDIVALADHAMDTHGHRGGAVELAEPYGIPLGCLQPVELDNLMVACRGASFSALAASSCRLSRTIMSIGEAAGAAAAGLMNYM